MIEEKRRKRRKGGLNEHFVDPSFAQPEKGKERKKRKGRTVANGTVGAEVVMEGVGGGGGGDDCVCDSGKGGEGG